MNDLERRRAAWAALSTLFLDTRPDPAFMAQQLRNTGFTVPELRRMLRAEVAPVLGRNLLSVAGVWDAFDLTGVQARFLAGRASPTLPGQLTCWLVRRDWAAVQRSLESDPPLDRTPPTG